MTSDIPKDIINGDVRNSYPTYSVQKQEMLAEHHGGRLPLPQEALVDKLAPPSLCKRPVKTRYASKCRLHYVINYLHVKIV